MLIRHVGHAEFLIETESGYRMVTDPYDRQSGYPVYEIAADALLISHDHHDHNAAEFITGNPYLIRDEGLYTPSSGIHVTALTGFHDAENGARRGKTLLFRIEAEGLTIVHLGDLGCPLNPEQIQVLQKPDVLMIPAGGYFTITGRQARETAETLGARIILPMHYKTDYNRDWPISGPEEFLEEYPEKQIVKNAEALRVTAGDMECQPHIVMFRQYKENTKDVR